MLLNETGKQTLFSFSFFCPKADKVLSGCLEDKKAVVKSLEKPSGKKSYKGTRENKQVKTEQQSRSEGGGEY